MKNAQRRDQLNIKEELREKQILGTVSERGIFKWVAISNASPELENETVDRIII